MKASCAPFVLALVIATNAGHPACCADASRREPTITIAALPFVEASADQRFASFAVAVGDILMTRLSAVERIAFVERSSIDEVLKELELSALTDAADQLRLGRVTGAQFVLTGSLTATGEQIQLAAHLLEVSTSRVARSAKVSASAAEVVAAVDGLARQLIVPFHGKLSELTARQIDQSPEANLHFMRGLGYYYAGMPEHATTQFLKTIAIDPGHAEARFYNGMNYMDVANEFEHAKVEFKRFLRDFGDHSLVGQANQRLQQCETRAGRSTGEVRH